MGNTKADLLQRLIIKARDETATGATPRDVLRYAIAGYLIGSLKYSEDQPRDDLGRWSDTGGGGGSGGGDGGSGGVEHMGIAADTAKSLGISPDSIEYGGEGYAFSVGDDNFTAAGQYDPSTGKITLYKGAMTSEINTKVVTAHEVQHAKYDVVVRKGYEAERVEVMKEFQANNYENADNILSPSGKLRGEYIDKYPLYNAFQPYFEGEQFNELVDRDGITGYSKSYWKAYHDGKVSSRTAINETLSEVAAQKALGINRDIPNVWRRMYNDVNSHYKKMKVSK